MDTGREDRSGAAMPILPPEPDLHPPTLFAHPPAGAWMVAVTKPRQDKALGRALTKLGTAWFAPTTPRRNRIRGKIVVARIPLFAGYVFVKGGPPDRIAVLATGRVLQVLRVPDQHRLDADLCQVRHLTGSGLPLESVDLLPAGTQVRIRDGLLAGLSGRVLRTAGVRRFVIAVDFLGRGVAVDLDAASLARLPTAPTLGS
jgi:transcription antitermination factor NusG